LLSARTTCSCPTISLKRRGRYLRAKTIDTIFAFYDSLLLAAATTRQWPHG
jgi:hypothetical protein